MKYDNIKYHLINTINEVTKEIYSLDEFSQNQIFNEDIIPDEPTLLFLNNSYYCLNELLLSLNNLWFFLWHLAYVFPFTKIIKFRMPIGNPLLFKYAIFFSSFHCIPAYWFMSSVTKREEKVSVPQAYVREPTLDEVREKINDVIGFTRVQFSCLN